MFATEWGNKKKKSLVINNKENIKIRKKSLLVWSEHCTECAVPLCYGKCLKYRKRKDGKCKLFENGINIINYSNNRGYEMHFEGWAKLESSYRVKQHSLLLSKFIYHFSNINFKIFSFLSSIIEKKNNIWKMTTLVYKAREFLTNIFEKYGKRPDCFIIKVISEEVDVNLILEVKSSTNSLYRKSFKLKKGINEFYIDYEELNFDRYNERKYIFIYPDKEISLTFLLLDFITLKKEDKIKISHENSNEIKLNQKKIKCIAWDLDNTLWNGILIEGKVKLNHEIFNIIKDMDSKGIVNSIVSKNNYEEAYAKLKEFNLDEYIVMPHINWIPKSENLKDLAKRMNIGIDTIAFIDDSPFELAEVKENCPEVLGINVLDIKEIYNMDCFNVIITDDSKNRRKTYKMLEQQQQELEKWDGNIDDFLKSCNMELQISKPKNEEIQRCYELIQRTNQLNSSGRRLELDEIQRIINDTDNYSTYVLKCKDKFGDYGIVGFSVIDKSDKITITDFVISCRVANKKVEHTFIQSISDEFCFNKNDCIYMNYKNTVKNGPIFNVVKDLKMKKVNNIGDIEIYEYNNSFVPKLDIISVKNI